MMPRPNPAPSDLALALLVPAARTDPVLRDWLVALNLAHFCPDSFREFANAYEGFLRERATGLMDDSEVMYSLETQLHEASASPAELEQAIETMTGWIIDRENIVMEDNEEFLASEERYGVIVRNVTRVLLVDKNFEDICALYEQLDVFLNGPQMDGDRRDDTLNQSRITTFSRKSIHEVSIMMASPSKMSISSHFQTGRKTLSQGKQDEEQRAFRENVNRLECRASIDSLHRFHDGASRFFATSSLPPTHSANESIRNEGFPNRKAAFLQHAALELADAHSKLGNFLEAFFAVREAISLSQQNMDETTLEASLKLLRSVRDRSNNIQSSQQNEFYSKKTSKNDISHLLARSNAPSSRSDLWEVLGHYPLATMWTKMLADNKLDSDTENPNVASHVLGYCRAELARLSLGVVAASEMGLDSSEAPLGLFLHAQDSVRDGNSSPLLIHLVSESALSACAIRLMDLRAWDRAERVMLMSKAVTGKDSSPLVLDRLVRTGRVSDAFSILSERLNHPSTTDFERCDTLLQMASIIPESAQSLVLALRAWALGKEIGARTLCALALALAAKAQFELCESKSALRLLKKCLPHLSVHAPIKDYFAAALLEVKCRAVLRNSDEASVRQTVKEFEALLTRIMEHRTEPTLITIIQEVFYWLAMGFDILGLHEEREKAAMGFFSDYSSGGGKPGDECENARAAEDVAMRTVDFAVSACSLTLTL